MTIGTPRVQILKKNCLTFSYIITKEKLLNIFIYNCNRTISTRRCSIDLGNLSDSLSTCEYNKLLYKNTKFIEAFFLCTGY